MEIKTGVRAVRRGHDRGRYFSTALCVFHRYVTLHVDLFEERERRRGQRLLCVGSVPTATHARHYFYKRLVSVVETATTCPRIWETRFAHNLRRNIGESRCAQKSSP